LIQEFQTCPNQTIAVGLSSTISSTVINEAHFSVSIDDVYNSLLASSPGLDRGQYGIGRQFWVQHGGVKTPHSFAGAKGGAGSPQWFGTTNGGNPIWTAPPAGTFNLQRGIRDNIYAPGLQNWNLALIKAFPVYRENRVEFRAEAYNFINHPNWASPNFTPTSATFGEVTQKTTSNPRTLQVGLRYSF
jgi:hypothetical protein